MRSDRRSYWRIIATLLLTLACTALPALAQEQSAPDPADSTAGTIFKWLNFIIVFGGIAWVISKLGAPFFRQNAKDISNSIQKAANERAEAERELNEVTQKLARIDAEVQEMRKAAATETASQAERIRVLAKAEVDRVGHAAKAEINASERAAAQELRAATARLATARASEIVRANMNPAAESGLFRSFLREVERSSN
jgi:F0F1-type ATP synthase membrane subunit b/b'